MLVLTESLGEAFEELQGALRGLEGSQKRLEEVSMEPLRSLRGVLKEFFWSFKETFTKPRRSSLGSSKESSSSLEGALINPRRSLKGASKEPSRSL